MDLPVGINKIPLFVLVVWTGSALGQSSTYCNNNYGLGFTASSYYNHSITSPNYPLDYDTNTDCLWEIQIDMWQNPGYIVKVIFNDFDLGLGQRTSDPNSCRFDYLKFYGDSLRSSDSLLGIYCSTIYPDVIYSTGQYLYVEFHSDVVISSRGFNFSFSAVKKEEAAAICRSPYLDSDVLSLRGSSGTFFSPDYPVPYPNAATCIWTITVPAGKRVKLTFKSFGLDTSVSDCSYKWRRHENDYIEIRDALSSDGKEIGYYCDFNARGVPPDVYSTGRYMWVKFHASADGFLQLKNDIGFKAHFDAVDPPSSNSSCLPGNVHNNDLRLTGSSGTLKTPQDYYPPGLNCNWLITVPEGKTVELTFNRFQLDPSRVCGDYVEVLDGQHVYSKTLGKFCGYDSFPEAIQSTSQYMRVTFESDLTEYTGYEGFEATFKALDKSSKFCCFLNLFSFFYVIIYLKVHVLRLE